MEEEIEAAPSNVIPISIGVIAVLLAGAALYFAFTAMQQINPIYESVESGTSAAAKTEKKMVRLESELAALSAKLDQQTKTLERLRIYVSQSEKAVKEVVSEVTVNRKQIVKNAETLSEFAAKGIRTAEAPPVTTKEAELSQSQPDTVQATSEAISTGTTYTIQEGDWYGKIAPKFGIKTQDLIDANPGIDPRQLRIGQVINIPAK